MLGKMVKDVFLFGEKGKERQRKKQKVQSETVATLCQSFSLSSTAPFMLN